MKKYALFIGVDHYEDPSITPLRCAARDARELAGLFKHKLGFDTSVLTHEELANGRSIIGEFRRVGRELGAGDLFVFFFAGHGKTTDTTNAPAADQLFLLPAVSALALDAGIVTGEGVLSYRGLRAETARWHGVQCAFILDACRLALRTEQASSRDGDNHARFAGEVVYRDLALASSQPDPSSGPFVLLNSCLDQQRAEELGNYQDGHGLFTASLLETLGDYDRMHKPVVIDDDLTAALAQRMQLLARKHGNRDTSQRPLRLGAALRLSSREETPAQRLALLLNDFERQLAVGYLDRPVGDNCLETLHHLGVKDYPRDSKQMLDQRLQAALDAREIAAQQQRDQQRFDAACKLGSGAAFANYLATCELCGHRQQAEAAIEAEKQRAGAREVAGNAQAKTREMPMARLGTGMKGLAMTAVLGLTVLLGYRFFVPGTQSAAAESSASALAAAPAVAAPVAVPAKTWAVGEQFQEDLAGGGKGPWMVVVPAGSFQIGSNEYDNEKGGQLVTIAKPFAVGKFEVTVGEYLACVAAKQCREPEWREAGSAYHYQTGSKDHYKNLGNALTASDFPIVGVSWDDARAYAGWLNENNGGKKGGYRLLSEAEWEYAARAGSTGRWGHGDDETQLAQFAWFSANSGDKTHQVGTNTANGFGLHDMHGNVWEWVDDVYHDNYVGAPQDGSAWLTKSKENRRVLRGGSWYFGPVYLRAAFRGVNAATDRNYFVGLRIARTLP